MDWSKYKFHCSSLGKLYTNQPGKKKTESVKDLSETAKAHLVECWIEETYGRKKDISNKYCEKGTLVEEDSITLYSLVKNEFFYKNDETIENEFFIGTPDVKDPLIDFKSPWDIFTFHSVIHKPIDKVYKCQLNGYSSILGADTARLVYCLIDAPDHLIVDAKKRVMWQMGIIDDLDPLYQEACERIEKEMTFGDIPREKRYIEFAIKRDDDLIKDLENRVIIGREFLQSLEESQT